MDTSTAAPAAQGLDWQNIIMAFCFTSALEIAQLSVQAKSGLSPSFCLLSFAILLTFLALFVAKLIGHKQKLAVVAKVLEKVAIIMAATAFVLTTTIPFSLRLMWASWALYAVSLLTIGICNFSEELIKLKRYCPTGSSVLSSLKKYVSFSGS